MKKKSKKSLDTVPLSIVKVRMLFCWNSEIYAIVLILFMKNWDVEESVDIWTEAQNLNTFYSTGLD
jgi:hypothetical protein